MYVWESKIQDEYTYRNKILGRPTNSTAIVTLFLACFGRPSPSFSRPIMWSVHSSRFIRLMTLWITASLSTSLGSRQRAVNRRVSKTERYGFNISCCSAYPEIFFHVEGSFSRPSMRMSPVMVPPVLYPAITSSSLMRIVKSQIQLETLTPWMD